MDKQNGNGSKGESLNQSGTRIECTIRITQPDGNVIEVETSSMGIIPELEKIDLTTRKGFMDFISMADKGIVAIRNETAKKALEAYANEALKNETSATERQIEAESGAFSLNVPNPLTKGMKPKEHFWSAEIISLTENTWIKMTNRVGIAFLNRLLHREGTESLKMKTLSEMCDRRGNEVMDYQNQHARNILVEHHFDPDTGIPQGDADLDSLQEDGSENILISQKRKAQIDEYIENYNSSKQDGISIQMTDQQWCNLETPDMSTVYIALDGVGVKRQKDKRESDKEKQTAPSANAEENLSAAPKQKGRPSVETSVAHINIGNNRYVLLADSMMKLCLNVLAFLLEFNLLTGYRLVFLVDGAKDIKASLEAVFGFRRYTVLLDWFHLRKHCAETISMMLRAGKENRDTQYRIKRTLFRHLWCGNVQGAISFIQGLSSDAIRNEARRRELIEYLERKEYAIQCYAVRRHLGLTTTSNPVEKANDLTVARRQKKKSMSWSRHGSIGLAALTALYMNNEAEGWHESHTLSYEMYEKYGDGMVAA